MTKKEARSKYFKEWSAHNPDKVKQYRKKYKASHKEELKMAAKDYYQRTKEHQNAYGKQRRKKIREQVLGHYGNKCAYCGETEYRFLAIDHINNDGAAQRKVLGQAKCSGFYEWIIDNNYPKDLQVLCHNCNFAKDKYNYKGPEPETFCLGSGI